MKYKVLLSFVFMFALILCGCNTDEDMQAQYDLGYADGQEEGYTEGYSAGLESAYESAYNTAAEQNLVPWERAWFYDCWQVRTKETSLTIREEPNKNAGKVAEVPMYEYIGVYDYSDDGKWGFIYYGSADGWVNLDYCAPSRDILVWATDTGKKYHKEDCRYLENSRHLITLSEAANMMLEPCSVCGGYGIK